MKGNPKLIEILNEQLSDELTAINQYIVHAEMCSNWGYGKLHDHFEKRAIDEMKHVGMLISRILFLEGQPVVSELKKIHTGSDVDKMFKNDHAHEKNTIAAYNEAIELAGEVQDFATREILEHILSDEDGHIDAIEENQNQIDHMTLGIYLSTKVD
ncbi:MAG TPA: bacterioferritin [Negativicutes bacterium]|nr:bacterioferritin [Negativicutes bacterium]